MPYPSYIVPPWGMTRREYYRHHSRKEYIHHAEFGYLPIFFLKFRPREPLTGQEAEDYAAFDIEHGHFYLILRQMERSLSLEYVTAANLVEYFPMFVKYFREHPEIVANLKPWTEYVK